MIANTTNAIPSWPNVNKAIESFQTQDKTLTKIIQFIPNIIKLIGAIFMDILNKPFEIFGLRPTAKGSERDITQDTQTRMVEKINNFWKKHKGKMLLGIGILGLGYYLSMNTDVPMPCSGDNKSEKDLVEIMFKYPGSGSISSSTPPESSRTRLRLDGKLDTTTSTCRSEFIPIKESDNYIGKRPVASIIGEIATKIMRLNGDVISVDVKRVYEENCILDAAGNLKWVRNFNLL